MAAVLKLAALEGKRMADLPALLNPADPWSTATDAQRLQAQRCAALIEPWAQRLRDGGSVTGLAAMIRAQYEAELMPLAWQHAVDQMGGLPSQSTLKRWLSGYKKHGLVGLLPEHTGRVRRNYGWEAKAIELFNVPSKTTMAGVAKELRYEYGFENATESRVARYLKALPARLGANGIARTGAHLHKLTMQKYQARHLDNIRAGDSYVGDGHTIDCYVAHPNTGKIWRPELTLFIDLKSRLPVGWWLGNSENVVDTLRALGAAISRFDHMPPMLYLDHGAGYRAKMMSAEGVGFAQQMGIDIMAAIPGNPHGKGWVENYFRRVRDEHDKFFAGGQFYCGDDMAPEINRRLSADVKSGKRKLPSFYDYKASLIRYLERFSHEPLELHEGRSAMQVWNESFVRIPAVLGVDELIRPMEEATVARQMVTLDKRTYLHPMLIDYQGQRVRVRYDLRDDQRVWICDQANRLICVAELTHKVAAIPSDRIEQARQVAEQKAVERHQYHIDEIKARNRAPITADTQLHAIEQLTGEAPALADDTPLPAKNKALATAKKLAPAATDVADIDLLNWRKDA
jgi:putative transposase